MLKILGETEDTEFAISQTKQILEIATDRDRWLSADQDAKKVLGAILKRYSDSCWPLVGEAILSDKFYLLSSLFKANQFQHDAPSVLWEAPTSIVVDWAAKHPSAVLRIFEIFALFTINEDGSYGWHPTIVKLLEQPFDDNWTSAIGSNLYSFGGWGSRVPGILGRIALLKQLNNHSSAKVRKMAQSLIAGFEEDKKHQAKHDEEYSAGII